MSKESWTGKDFYERLGLNRHATIAEIKSEYRWLAKKFHPDTNDGDKRAARRFQEINEAYEVLSNPELKVEYDAFLRVKETGEDKPSYPNRTPPPNSPRPNPPGQFPQGSSQSPRPQTPTAPTSPRNSDRRLGPIIATSIAAVVLTLSILASIFVAISGSSTGSSGQKAASWGPSEAESRNADITTCNEFWAYTFPSNWFSSIESSRQALSKVRGMTGPANSVSVRGAAVSLAFQLETYVLTLENQVASGLSIANGNEFAAPGVVNSHNNLIDACMAVFEGS